jgi:biopolymer transport protein ExbD
VPTLDDCYPWQPGGCEWTIRYLWRWMSSFGRLDVIVLALMLVYLLAVVIHVCCRYHLARRARGIDSASRRTLAAVLNIEVGSLKSIALTAPYLGLVGTCEGILNGFVGGAMQKKQALMLMIATKIGFALIPTAAGIPVAVLATCSYNYLRTRIDLLEGEASDERQQRGRHFRGARRFSPAKRFSELPAFGLIAAPVLAIAIMGYMTFASFHTSTGFDVEPASARCEFDGEDKLIVLHLTDAGKLFLNQEQADWNSLAGRLSVIYSMREHRTLYLLADSGVPFQTVAHALDAVESAPAAVGPQVVGMRMDRLYIKVRLVTPAALSADCPKPVVTGSGHHVLR